MEVLISASEAATIIGVTRASVHNFVKAGKLKVKSELGIQRQKFFDKDEVLELAKRYNRDGQAA